MRRLAVCLVALLCLITGASALDGYGYYQVISYNATDVSEYQQDLAIHRTTGTAYEETSGGLNIWHLYVGDHCQDDYGDIRFTNSTGGELAYYLWPDYTDESARFCVRLEGATSAGTLTVHYGNATAATTSDGDAVGYCDAFSEIGAAWDTSGVATATIDAGRLKTTGIANTWTAYTTAAAVRNVAVSGPFMASINLDYVAAPGPLGKLYFTVCTASSRSSIGYQDDNADNSGGLTYVINGGSEVFSGKGTRPASGSMALMITRDSADTVRVYENGVLKGQGTMPGNLTKIALTNIRFQTYNGNIAYWDNLCIRAYSATPPAATIFSDELTPAGVLQPFPGLSLLPSDPDSDGLYEDINGNERLDYNDLTVFFQNHAWAKTNQPIACFDFNGNGWLDYNDVIALFATIMEAHA